MPSVAPVKLVKVISLLIILLCGTAISFGLDAAANVPSSGLIYYPPEAQVLFRDEFESGDYSAWNGTTTLTGNSATVVATGPYEGTWHARFLTNAISSGVSYAYSYIDLSSMASEIYARAYFRTIEGLPLDDEDDRIGLIGLEVGGQLQITLRIHRSGGVDRFSIIGLSGSSTVSISTDDVHPARGEWYCLELYVRIHATIGEYRAWINGAQQITITNIDTTRYGSSVSRVRFGLTYTANVQHSVEIYCDSAAVSTSRIGLLNAFGVIGNAAEAPAIRNFYWLLGNQSISYKTLIPSEVKGYADIAFFDGLIVWTKSGGYNSTAVRLFGQSRVVISDMYDFCNILYPNLSGSTQVVSTNTVTYASDWGNFRNGDAVEMRNETGNVDKLTTVISSGPAELAEVKVIARYDSTRIALFHMSGTQAKSGFYVMDLDATTPETEWTGIWHVFPAIKMVRDFPTGAYARWMANGTRWWNLAWVYNYIDKLASENMDIVSKSVIGNSVQGNEIRAMTIGKGSRYAIIDGAIHGDEKTGVFACLRIAELLIQYYRSDSFWRSRLTEYKVIIIPVLNPDGFIGNTRYNYNGKDLNSQFPPESNTTEPEAWALRNLMGNYTPTIYVNVHEGWNWYPLDMLYGNHETGTNRTLTINALRQANSTFVGLRHWGWFNEDHSDVWVGKVDAIYQGGKSGMAVSYASYTYQASCMLPETFVWSQTWGARKCLWGIEYYTTVILAFLQNIQR